MIGPIFKISINDWFEPINLIKSLEKNMFPSYSNVPWIMSGCIECYKKLKQILLTVAVVYQDPSQPNQ